MSRVSFRKFSARMKMKKLFKEISGSIVAPQGFLASGVFCDIKRLGTGKGSNKGQKRDLALIVSEVPATVAGMFTTNQVCAAPVKVCVERVKKGTPRPWSSIPATPTPAPANKVLRTPRNDRPAGGRCICPAEHVLVGSTGRIGVTLPMANVRAGIIEAWRCSATRRPADDAVEAIMTSDTRPKQFAVEFKLGGKTVRIGGICKGAGMIQPGMSPHRRAAGGPAARGLARDDALFHHHGRGH
jgi:glutamate N-acetyltransferase / amino-acid N-acetyltransferase